MAESGLLVTISGPALSLLFYENACSDGNEMGFLLGNVEIFVTNNVTDSERHVETTRRCVEITGVLTCPTTINLYNHSGKVCQKNLRDIIRERGKEIVGWFRFRRNSRLVPTFRDKALHKELASYFNECNADSPKDMFLACILSTSMTEKQGTHKFRHVLLRYDNGLYRPVPLRIKNLGDGAAHNDGSSYMPTPVASQLHEPDVFTKFVRSLKLDPRNKSGIDVVMSIQKSAEHHLKSLIRKVSESDREVHALENQVRDCRGKLHVKIVTPVNLEQVNQQINDLTRLPPVHIDELKNFQMGMKQEAQPRTSYMIDDSSLVKNRTAGRPRDSINPRLGSGDSAQRSPPSHRSYSHAAKNNSEDDLFDGSDG